MTQATRSRLLKKDSEQVWDRFPTGDNEYATMRF